ncbi:MAG: threonine/serine dehydratase [Phenylobacterium sp.]|uniref:threonine ammonia-lyase n=1 Tax=Phenylobacterium sp. TaxID=1871053 RepID=UPI0025F8272A|nr:threonine/serine dehydratase [Phenylobacterium sp.]MCA3711828.1 threonine/serine dehydratase [Phenylobacterium sp.]MCA3731306.1 threonine/serine dehydratase [Phenylobacterium sp.]MCA3751359.1 threonine/serine dehydratase [Phenylobacterium sp.]MCA6271734.1 threonine/serine dehydratase [Phenylobacterium sp.]MCA6278488.1 threonine/serine dehydratase [Phenylobacterium sp.]
MSGVVFADIEAAAERLAGQAVVTPLIESPALNERLGLRVLIKPETLQRVGAFKFRGAFNRLSQIAPADRPRGVVAFSSGNHAQGVALAARLLDMPAVIVMPADAPAVKVSATRGYGAEVVFYDRMTESREAIAARLAEERGAVIVPAYDDPDIIAGQGTAGLELARQVQALGAELDLVVGPVGGGGLMAGVAIAVQTLSPKTRIVGVEPELYDDARRSLVSGRRETAAPTVRTLCDSLETPSTGELTFPILRERLSAIVTVSDSEVAEAVRMAFSTLKLVVEPGGAAGLAALMAAKVPETAPGACVGLVLSGGNVDPDLFARVLRGEF